MQPTPGISDALPESDRRPKVGVGVFVLNSKNEFLMGKRKGSNGAGTYALPGGHLEFQESFEDCASRELQEETGLKVEPDNVKFLTCTNNILIQDKGKHYVTVFMSVRAPENQEAQNLEPEKCEGWEWISWQQLLDWIRQGESMEDSEQHADARKLFPPMLTLVKTRPDLLPQAALS
ncbi:hypothetical protein P389DRAFT_198991 [Cystobasidium minutum MCA 4210]|uniref:uncharacterized protein n=1 Tax=Cystobasidium minutum MCA 4210 TaxID=1397322 RepID=UPI0034CD1D2D|eukprot:jgi/Rhomi1/198991/gm1.7205_g